METKICRVCKLEKPITKFHMNGRYRRGECADCAALHDGPRGELLREQKRDWMYLFLLDKSCCMCGEDRIPDLEFHHLDPSLKENTISKYIQNCSPLSKLQDEVSKCIILCSNCHLLLTNMERNTHKWKYFLEHQSDQALIFINKFNSLNLT